MKKLLTNGKNISVEITNISKHGFWLWANNKEYFLSFEDFPWFKEQPIQKIFNIVEVSPGHFYWPQLDIDLNIEIIEHPEKFPLVAGNK